MRPENPRACRAAAVDDTLHQTCLVLQADDASTFELAPVSLWLEDLSAVRKLLEDWTRAGIVSVRDHVAADPARLASLRAAIVVLKVNRRTLTLYEARDSTHLLENLRRVFDEETVPALLHSVEALWDSRTGFSTSAINTTLGGRRLEIQFCGNILAGHEESWDRVLIAAEDVTGLQEARREAASAAAYARGLFEHSPVALMVKDFSGVKRLLDTEVAPGCLDLGLFMDTSEDFRLRCIEAMRIMDSNRQSRRLLGTADAGTSTGRHLDLLHSNFASTLRDRVIGLWNGELFQERETTLTRLDGSRIHVHEQVSVLPGHERDWALVQVAWLDITARKAAELHLAQLRDHDALTGVFGRAYYNLELLRLSRFDIGPVNVLVADLDGLKSANDDRGHAAGDVLLQRAGALLAKVCRTGWTIARTGGDEFVMLMPAPRQHDLVDVVLEIRDRLRADNILWPAPGLSLSIGVATRISGEALADTVSRADAGMYREKRKHHKERRSDPAPSYEEAKGGLTAAAGR